MTAVVTIKESYSNFLKIGASSVTHRVPRIMEGLDAPDGKHYS